MKNFKKLIAVATIIGSLGVVGVVGVAGASYSSGATTPANILAGLTGQSVEQVTAERATGSTYATIAQDAGMLEELKAEILAQKKVILDQRVKDGNLAQEQADTIYKSIEANQATCDGTGSAGIGQKDAAGFGQGQGMGMGSGQRNGGGRGMNTGNSSIQ